MKLIYVYGNGDYDAVTFEQAGYDDPETLRELFDGAWSNDNHSYTLEFKDDEGYDCEVEIDAYEFSEVDEEFINFVRNEIQDYDQSKCANFYVV